MSIADVSIERLLIIDDNESIHSDFKKIFSRPCLDHELSAMDAELFGDDATIADNHPCYELSFASQGRHLYRVLGSQLGQHCRTTRTHR